MLQNKLYTIWQVVKYNPVLLASPIFLTLQGLKSSINTSSRERRASALCILVLQSKTFSGCAESQSGPDVC